MKILIIHNRYKHRGGEDVAVELDLDLFNSNGHQAELLLFDNDEIGETAGVLKQAYQSFYNKNSAEIFNKKIDSFLPDIVHVHNIYFTASPSILHIAYSRNIPVIFTLHNYRMVCANVLLLRDNQVCEKCVKKIFPLDGIIHKCYHGYGGSALVTMITALNKINGTWKNKVARFIALTNFAREKLEHSSLHPRKGQIVIKPNFVPDPGGNAATRDKYFLFVGRLSKEKGADILCEAFSAMPGEQVIIAGGGPDAEQLHAKYAVHKNIRFTGPVDRGTVQELMQKALALVVPSIWYEGLPYTVLESFSNGTPVIGSALGGIREAVETGKNGFLFEPGNSASVVAAIRNFLALIREDEQIYATTRQSYLEKYTPEKSLEKILSVYNEVLNERKMVSHE